MSTDARIIDPDTLEVAQGEQGEIVVHGPEVFEGYWQRPEATEQAFLELDGKRFSEQVIWVELTRMATSLSPTASSA